MLARLKTNWRELKKGKPGHRFTDRYTRRNEATKGRVNLRKVLNIGLGIALTVGGLVFNPRRVRVRSCWLLDWDF